MADIFVWLDLQLIQDGSKRWLWTVRTDTGILAAGTTSTLQAAMWEGRQALQQTVDTLHDSFPGATVGRVEQAQARIGDAMCDLDRIDELLRQAGIRPPVPGQ